MKSVSRYSVFFVMSCFSVLSATGQTLRTGIYNSPGQASAYGDPDSPDALFVADGGSTKESFGVEGNVNLSGQELRVNALNGGGEFTFGVAKNPDFQWVAGRTYGFSQSYSGDETKELVFTLNDAFSNRSYSVRQKVEFGNVGLLMIRERTPKSTDTQSSSIAFERMSLNGKEVVGSVGLKSGTDFDRAHYATLSGIDFTKAWTFAGDVTMDWSGAKPKPNKLNFQIKAMQAGFEVVPEPSSAMLAAGGVLALVLRRKRSDEA